eukprot:TRINITY_DN83114_c0_g1_i1.p1 TRINITY_DN83114_c0_g1~~TRINITY_DN83114_c0_g1_i1.p1  ORF type:complete len:643 (+),score=211.59 TRINITY_DN83114_c0_g1_i1:135-2063(+)
MAEPTSPTAPAAKVAAPAAKTAVAHADGGVVTKTSSGGTTPAKMQSKLSEKVQKKAASAHAAAGGQQAAALRSTKDMQYYTVEEVARHNHTKGLWLIMNRKVYDVTSFFMYHPGGPEILLSFGGKDATTQASAAHKGTLPSNVMKEFEIGYIKMTSPDDPPPKIKKSKKPKGTTTLPVYETPKAVENLKAPAREKILSRANKPKEEGSTQVKDKKENTQFEYGPRVLDGCPNTGNESGMLRDLRRQQEPETEAKAKAKQATKDKERHDIREITERVMKIFYEAAEAGGGVQQEEMYDEPAYQDIPEEPVAEESEGEDWFAALEAQERAARANESKATYQERLKAVKAEQEAHLKVIKNRKDKEKQLREQREKEDREWFERKQNGTAQPEAAVTNGVTNGVHQADSNGHTNGHAAGYAPAPVAEAALPDGYRVGDKVYWCGGKQRFASGNVLVFGLQGRVQGRGSQPKRLSVKFDGNETAMDIALYQMSRTPPVIPGGYMVGDEIYFCGERESFSNGDVLCFGLVGEVQGRSTTGDAADERRLRALFDGHKAGITIFLNQVTKEPPVIPGGLQIDQFVYYCGKKNQQFNNGDKLIYGTQGRVTGRSTMGDETDDRRVKVRFEGNKGPVNVFLAEVSVTPPADQ